MMRHEHVLIVRLICACHNYTVKSEKHNFRAKRTPLLDNNTQTRASISTRSHSNAVYTRNIVYKNKYFEQTMVYKLMLFCLKKKKKISCSKTGYGGAEWLFPVQMQF
jgi:hypothetical protein